MRLDYSFESDVHSRCGLAHVAAKLRGGPCRIAYLGNSVTAQRHGYVPHLHDRLCNAFDQPHRAIRAGLGGMGSIGCLYTLADLVLRHQPDFCFIECTTGDLPSGLPPSRIGAVIEGLLRRLSGIQCEVCLLHMYSNGYRFSGDNPVLAQYERVADHYRAPSINVGRAMEIAIAAGVVVLRDVATDGIHLSPQGAELTAEMIADATLKLLDVKDARRIVELPFLHNDRYDQVELMPVQSEMLTDASRGQHAKFRLAYPCIEFEARNEMTFRAGGGKVDGILFVAGPRSGYLEVETPEERKEYLLWDRWCDRERLNTLVFDPPINGNDEFRIRVLDKPLPSGMATGDRMPRSFKAVAFMVRERSVSPADPGRR